MVKSNLEWLSQNVNKLKTLFNEINFQNKTKVNIF